MKTIHFFLVICIAVFGCNENQSQKRTSVLLNGEWDIAQSLKDKIPEEFNRAVPVPGMVDLAVPAFDSVGFQNGLRNYFWYRTKFTSDQEDFTSVKLKVHKAKFAPKIWLNGKELGHSYKNFTPTEYDITGALAEVGKENELVVRLFAHHELLPDSVVWGHDFEIIRYTPGIYDNVELIYANAPLIENVQIVPDILNREIQAIVWLDKVDRAKPQIRFRITEDKGGKEISKGIEYLPMTEVQGRDAVILTIKIPDCTLWSPENPFLYNLDVETAGDHFSSRFGMRKFEFNSKTGFAELNGETYFMRGTNICFHRFMDDDLRTTQPWDKSWVRKLYQTIKDMNMNSFRFCLGFPPEFWYDMADEMGFLVADEYPIWYGTNPEAFNKLPTSNELVKEYTSWMEERWNHASVVLWDAQNESVVGFTGEAIQKVRALDISNRPWDNGYAPPMAPTDPIEAHPYILQNYLGRKPGVYGPVYPYLKDRIIPDNGPSELSPPADGGKYPNPIINNENVFFWIGRNGRPTWLTRTIYENIYGKGLSVDDYRRINSKMLGRLLSYWRVHRTSAAVSHFCMLGYSREDTVETARIVNTQRGATSDNFIDINRLILEPNFKRDAFNAFYPIGMFINRWEAIQVAGSSLELPVLYCNDLYTSEDIETSVTLTFDDVKETDETHHVHLEGLKTATLDLMLELPERTGSVTVEVSFNHHDHVISQQYEFELVDDLEDHINSDAGENRQFIHNEDSNN